MFNKHPAPGETPSDRSDPADPGKFSAWPDYVTGGRPRSAAVVIRRKDGGVVGTCLRLEHYSDADLDHWADHLTASAWVRSCWVAWPIR